MTTTRRAFLLGCDSGGLNYCATDAVKLAAALEKIGYDRARIKIPSADQVAPCYNLERLLREFCRECGDQDLAIFYFAGHGWVDKRNRFNLSLADDLNDYDNNFSNARLLEALESCSARDKLLILDCCQAGASQKPLKDYDWRAVDAGERFQVFTAAGSKENTIEIDGPSPGGLFTDFLCRALSRAAEGRLGRGGKLWLDDVDQYTQRLARRHRAADDRQVAIPGVYGKTSHRILLAEGIPHPTGYPPTLIEDLYTVCDELCVGAKAIRDSYAYCRGRADSALLPSLPEDADAQKVIELLVDPKCYYSAGSRLRLPLLSFVAHLRKTLGDPTVLGSWLDQAREWLVRDAALPTEHVDEAIQVIAFAQGDAQPYLMIEIAQDLQAADGHRLEWVYLDEHGDPVRRADPTENLRDFAEIAARVGDAVRALPTAAGRVPQVEVLLPFDLLSNQAFIDALERAPVDRRAAAHRPGLGVGHLAFRYPLVLRCWERWRETLHYKTRGRAEALEFWRVNRACLTRSAGSHCLSWLNPRQEPDLVMAALRCLMSTAERHPGSLALGMEQPLTEDDLDGLLEVGTPVLLWPRHPAASAAVRETVRLGVGACADADSILDLPRAIWTKRKAQAAARDPSPGVSLLWDEFNADRRILVLPNLDTAFIGA